ncbi:MAG TPA: hypothetical protein VHM67_10755 [Gemmatimonadaceae bacterium]|nr:hypothetical protein [Gemmatimonadaceae bacterium]
MNRPHRSRFVPALPSLVSFALLLVCAPASGAQQETGSATPVRFVVLDYMKVAPGKTDEYLRLERQVWKPVHQARIKNKQMVAWELYDVRYTADTPRQYDYVTANVYDSFAATGADSTFEQVFRRVHGANASRLLAQTEGARVTVRSEIWRLVDGTTMRSATGAPSRYLQVDFMRSKPGADYVAVERDLWKPVHQHRVTAGALDQWSLFELMLPGGTSYPYDYGTVNAVSNLSALAAGVTADLFQRVHPNTPIADIARRTLASRDLTRSELWILVDAAR